MKKFQALVAALVFTMALFQSHAAMAQTVLITGANTGIGLAFAKAYAARSWTVIATHHQSTVPAELAGLSAQYKNVRVEKMDVSSKDEVDALAAKLKDVPIDVLINNAGVYARSGAPHSQDFGQFDYSLFDTIMAVNVRGPLMVMEAFVGNVKAGHQKKIINISSTVGSLTAPYPGGGAIFYRASKAALNKEMQVLADVLKPDGISVVMIHPGLVRTDRLISLAPGVVTNKDYVDAPESVSRMVPTIDKVTIADTGHFMRYDGVSLPW
jgi:NAD(P)-dependent dehydrogenase (short-subunit alcohol dehydrogenase family)